MQAPFDPTLETVIVVDDEHHLRVTLSQTLELAGYQVLAYAQAQEALTHIGEADEWPGVIISDIRMPKMDGLAFLEALQRLDPDLPVILITGHGDISTAVAAMRQGAYDFLEKPFSQEILLDGVRRALEKRRLTLENRTLKQQLAVHSAPGPRIIGRTPSVQRLHTMITRVAAVNTDILLWGETGSGKDLIARYIHAHSPRSAQNFVAINCGAIPEAIMESELFGHESGAFTGAQRKRIGKFEHAQKGTVFLDEIESMPMNLQVKLLRVLQERTLERLGSNTQIPLDIRVLAATKVDLLQEAAAGRFREDLYYRLNVVTLNIPPLRERLEDIPLLFQHFVLVAANRIGQSPPPLEASHLSVLMSHTWPGNVRELRNLAERYVLLGEAYAYDLDEMLHGQASTQALTLPQQVEIFEKSLIRQELERQQGSIKATMEALGIPRKTLYDKLKKYALSREEFVQ